MVQVTRKSGQRVSIGGIGAKGVTTDGPFVETEEMLGGFWVLELADLDEALQVAQRASAACCGAVEVRPFPPA